MKVAIAAALAAAAAVQAKHLSSECLEVVYSRMVELNTHSWENGTRSEATLEWKHPELSVFGVQQGNLLPDSLTEDSIPEIMQIANDAMDNRPAPTTTTAARTSATPSSEATEAPLRAKRQAASSAISAHSSRTSSHAASATGHCANTPYKLNPQLPNGSPLVPADGAAGDPPSLGVAVLMADKATNGGTRNHSTYGEAAQSQLNFTLYHVPQASNGAISHRECTMQLWADNVYMVPPFLAYYGAAHNNRTVMDEAYNQIKTYRELLQDSSTKLWKHMTLSLEAHDQTLWATGNAWAVAGAARVIATMRASPFADDLSSEMADIQSWAAEIFEAARPHITDKGLLRNHINDSSSFEDSAASALVAAAGLRFSTMNLTNDYVDMSLTLLGGASRNVNSSGYLNHVVNPMTFVNETTESPEGQSFMILAYAAYNDWDKAGRPGNTKTGSDPLAGAASPRAALGVPAILAAAALAYVLV